MQPILGLYDNRYNWYGICHGKSVVFVDSLIVTGALSANGQSFDLSERGKSSGVD